MGQQENIKVNLICKRCYHAKESQVDIIVHDVFQVEDKV